MRWMLVGTGAEIRKVLLSEIIRRRTEGVTKESRLHKSSSFIVTEIFDIKEIKFYLCSVGAW